MAVWNTGNPSTTTQEFIQLTANTRTFRSTIYSHVTVATDPDNVK